VGRPPRAPGGGGRWRARSLLAASLACAACGLVYELGLINLATALVGSSLRSTSLVLGIFVFSMGLGSLVAKRLTRRPLAAFVGVEVTLAAVGGASGLILYEAFARFGSYEQPVLLLAALIGGLIGAEIPLLMEMLQRLRSRRASDDAADLMAADYVGALVAGLAFPFLLVPSLGLVRSSLVTGLVNVVAAGIVVAATGAADRRRAVLAGGTLVVAVAMLATGLWRAEGWVVSARQRLYDDPIVAVEQTRYQEVVLTSSRGRLDDVRLYLNGDLQFSTVDEHRYHEALVHPVLGGGRRDRVLVLGGGDGLAVREILRYPDVQEVVVVELDAAVTRFASERPELVAVNGASLLDPRVTLVHADAFTWAHEAGGTDAPFDVVIVDLPDPDSLDLARLYSVEMYSAVRSLVAPGGRVVVQAGSPYFAPDAFWCVRSTLATAGFATAPYHVDVPSFGDWGFVAAAPVAPAHGTRASAVATAPPELTIDTGVEGDLRFMTADVLAAARVFPDDVVRPDPPPSTLVDPRIARYTAEGWNAW
jgi:spermidine synthase